MMHQPEIRTAADLGTEDLELIAEAVFAAEVEEPRMHRQPLASYRFQLHKDFGFDKVTELIDYLAEMGVTDVYLSPCLTARPGSTHGYDVCDHAKLNPELGGEDAHAFLLRRLRERDMGRILDVVPNHMGILGGNRYWREVLELGHYAPSARFFDIDWDPAKQDLKDQILIPILEDQYGKVLEAGKLRLRLEKGEFTINYYEHEFPIYPRSCATILGLRFETLRERLGGGDEHYLEYMSILAASRYLPRRGERDLSRARDLLMEKEVIKRRLRRLVEESPVVADFLTENLALIQGEEGRPSSFDLLHELLEEQVYRLAYWRVASHEINYRRFFDINELAGLRTEDPAVFEAVHALIFEWVVEGGVSALRVDHPDGLADPVGYFRDLQKSIFLRQCRSRLEREMPETAVHWSKIASNLIQLYDTAIASYGGGALRKRFPIIVEKILSRGEDLPREWPIHGTVGYEFLNLLNGLFVDTNGQYALETSYLEFTDDDVPFAELLYRSKLLICDTSMVSEINMLARQLDVVSEHDRRSRDFTLNDLTQAVKEVIACFPVYRTYVQPGKPIHHRDRATIGRAVARARSRNPSLDASVLEFVSDAVLGRHPEGVTPQDRAGREEFVRKFQQTTGPVQAKGLEDTAFYRRVMLISLNEVGADPLRFATSPSTFHALNALRLERWPGGFSSTATHDTKRGEGTRVRINALSEMPEEWRTRLARWSRANARFKSLVQGRCAPDAREEYLFYQVLLGTWPFSIPQGNPPEAYVRRIQKYMVKAAREAKINTSWTDRDQSYAQILERFVSDVLTLPDASGFLRDFLVFQERVARIGVLNALSQTLIKSASPGVPDIYQGCELWDLSLVDPDNRRPVNYHARMLLLNQFRRQLISGIPRAEIVRDLFHAYHDGAVKLFFLWTALNHRKAFPDLYLRGTYRPLEVEGPRRGNILAFARYREGRAVVVVVPRLSAGLIPETPDSLQLDPNIWEGSSLIIPENAPKCRHDLLTDTPCVVPSPGEDGRLAIPLSQLFRVLPYAYLASDARGMPGVKTPSASPQNSADGAASG